MKYKFTFKTPGPFFYILERLLAIIDSKSKIDTTKNKQATKQAKERIDKKLIT